MILVPYDLLPALGLLGLMLATIVWCDGWSRGHEHRRRHEEDLRNGPRP